MADNGGERGGGRRDEEFDGLPMFDERQARREKRAENKKGRDWLSQAVTLANIVGWWLVFLIWVFIDWAKPQKESFWTRFSKQPPNYSWNVGLLRIALVMQVAVIVLSAAGLVISIVRHRRRGDKISKAILILLGVSIIGCVAFAVQYAGLLF